MNFDLNEEQKMIQEMVRKFANNDVKPLAAEIDHTNVIPDKLLKKMADLNLFGTTVPEEYDGAGMDTISYAITIEEISRVCGAAAVVMAVQNSLVNFILLKYGTEEQKEKYLKPLARGEMIGSFALTEPNAGSDVVSISTTAKLDGDYYVINGSKIFITNSQFANVFLVFATLDKAKGVRGITCFIVERGHAGFTVGKSEDLLGMRGIGVSPLSFEDCRVHKDSILGGIGSGFKMAMHALDGGRIGVGAQSVGIAQAALDSARQYAKERVQFGQSINKFQLIQDMLVNMAVKIQSARLLVYHAAFLKDQGKKVTTEAAMAKLCASEAAMWSATKSMQIHGGYGYVKEYPIERYFRDAKVLEIYEGTSEVQKLVIAKDL